MADHEHEKHLVGKDAADHLIKEHGINIYTMPVGTRASTTHDAEHQEVATLRMPIEKAVKQLVRVYGWKALAAEVKAQELSSQMNTGGVI